MIVGCVIVVIEDIRVLGECVCVCVCEMDCGDGTT